MGIYDRRLYELSCNSCNENWKKVTDEFDIVGLRCPHCNKRNFKVIKRIELDIDNDKE